MEQVTRIGLIYSGSKQNFVGPVAALVAALPSDVQVVERWADDDAGILADAVKELVEDADVKVIVAAGGPDPALRLMKETKDQKIDKPIVFTTVADPKASGLVVEKDKPGKNLTGMAGRTSELDAARLALLTAFVRAQPGDKFGVLRFENRDHGDEQYKEVENMARNLGVHLRPKKANTVPGIERAFAFFARENVKGVVVTADSFSTIIGRTWSRPPGTSRPSISGRNLWIWAGWSATGRASLRPTRWPAST